MFRLSWRTFNRSSFEIYRAPGITRHQGAYRKGSRDRSDQAFDALLIPNPTALKIRQLQMGRSTDTPEARSGRTHSAASAVPGNAP